jgi:hypothetical protein
MGRAADLRHDYELLGDRLETAEGSAAAAIARERRLIAEQLERLERAEGEVPLVDQLAAKRAESGVGRPPSRRRKSG